MVRLLQKCIHLFKITLNFNPYNLTYPLELTLLEELV